MTHNQIIELPDLITFEDGDIQETQISFTRGDGRMEIYTTDNTMLTKLKRLVNISPEEYRTERVIRSRKGNAVAVVVSAPVGFLTLRSKKRECSEAQREARRQNMKVVNKNKGKTL